MSRQRGNGSGTVYRRTDGGPWYASWYDHDGKRRTRCTGTTDKQKATRILGEWVGQAALRVAGVIDPRQEAIVNQSKRPLRDYLNAFENKMLAAKRTERHVANTLSLVREVVDAGQFATPADISIDPINAHLRGMLDAGASARTVGARVVAIKAFVHWLIETNKLTTNPLAALRKPSVRADRKRRRRMLLPDEWPWLLSATITGQPWNGISPVERALLYATAIQTGLRSNELRSLVRADLFLAGDRPHVRCRAENTKNDEPAKQYVQADLAEQLRQHVAAKSPSAAVFSMPDEYDVASMLRADLAAARSAWLDEVRHDPAAQAKRAETTFLAPTNDQGEQLDFHALRHTTGAWLALQGNHPKAIQAVMRHSSITLTMDTYGHLLPDQHADAIGTLESFFSPPGAVAEAVGLSAVQIAVAMQTGASGCKKSDREGDQSELAATLKFQGKRGGNEEKKGESKSASCRARTYDPLIKSQLPNQTHQGLASQVSSTDSNQNHACILGEMASDCYCGTEQCCDTLICRTKRAALRWALAELEGGRQ